MRRTEDGLHSDSDSSTVPAVTSLTCGYIVLRLVEKFIPMSAREAHNQFEKFNEISSGATFLKRPKTKLAKSIIIWQASKFREQTSESMLDSLKQFNESL